LNRTTIANGDIKHVSADAHDLLVAAPLQAPDYAALETADSSTHVFNTTKRLQESQGSSAFLDSEIGAVV
jgi:hypothetical protein